tara:strand:- start:370 stop:474 length:105 start_codon:yes stop_codon:yes gene_type:complete
VGSLAAFGKSIVKRNAAEIENENNRLETGMNSNN